MNPFNDLLDTLAYAVLTVELIPPLEVDEDPCCGEADPCAFPFCSAYDSQADDLCETCRSPETCQTYEDCIGPDIPYVDPATVGPGTTYTTQTNPEGPVYPPQEPLRSFTVYYQDGIVYARGVCFPSGQVVLDTHPLWGYFTPFPNFQEAYYALVQRQGFVILFDALGGHGS